MAPVGGRRLSPSGTEYRTALISFFVLCATAGVPLSWGKTAGGDKVTWVGFELLHHTYHLEISERRAAWFVKWAEEVASSDSINTASFEQGLGRLMYVAGALEYERPFLSPLYSFLSLSALPSLRETFPAVPCSPSLTVSALHLCDHDASLGHGSTGRRTSE